MSAEIVQFIPRPNRKRYQSLESQARSIMAPFLADAHEKAIYESSLGFIADEKEPA